MFVEKTTNNNKNTRPHSSLAWKKTEHWKSSVVHWYCHTATISETERRLVWRPAGSRSKTLTAVSVVGRTRSRPDFSELSISKLAKRSVFNHKDKVWRERTSLRRFSWLKVTGFVMKVLRKMKVKSLEVSLLRHFEVTETSLEYQIYICAHLPNIFVTHKKVKS